MSMSSPLRSLVYAPFQNLPRRYGCFSYGIFVNSEPIAKRLRNRKRRERRSLHSGRNLNSLITVSDKLDHTPISNTLPRQHASPLSFLPLSALLRSYIITSLSASPILLHLSLCILSALAHSSSPFLNPDRNPLLHWLLKRTFYSQFCAGETPGEVKKTVDGLKEMGYKGVILGYAREVVLDESPKENVQADTIEEIEAWKHGTLETVRLAVKGDYVALKYECFACSSL